MIAGGRLNVKKVVQYVTVCKYNKVNITHEVVVEKTNSQILTIDELSAYLKISRFTIYDWVYHKKIPYIKLGRNLWFKKELIDVWLKSKLHLPFELNREKMYNDDTTVGSGERSRL